MNASTSRGVTQIYIMSFETEDCQYISLFIKFVYKIFLCLKINQTVYDLQGHCNFFAQCALVASQREIDMKVIIDH